MTNRHVGAVEHESLNRQLRERMHRGSAAITYVALLLYACGPASAQTLMPPFDTSYSVVDLGSVPNVPANYGGLTFIPGDSTRLLIAGAANGAAGQLFSIQLVRNSANHITGFSGMAMLYADDAANNDGGLSFGPNGVLFYSRYPLNEIGQFKPGSTRPDRVVALNALGVSSSTGGLAFVPSGFPGAGQLKIAIYNSYHWYAATVSPDASGTFDIVAPTLKTTIFGGPEGVVYVPPGSPQFPDFTRVLVCEYGAGQVAVYTIDANGDPIPATRTAFLTGLSGAEGAAIDPFSGDFLFSTYGGGNHVIAVRGFAAQATATPTATLTLAPTATFTPTRTATLSPTTTVTPVPTPVTTATSSMPTASPTPTRTATPSVEPTPGTVTVDGIVLKPGREGMGEHGLVPAVGVTVDLFVCEHRPRCLKSPGGAAASVVTDAAGRFQITVPVGIVRGRLLLLTAAIDGIRLRVLVVPRLLGLGTGGGANAVGVTISSVSEGATRLLESAGLENYDDAGIEALLSAVETSNADTDFTGLTVADAAALAETTAANDPEVQMVLADNRMTPTPTSVCVGDCGDDRSVTIDDIIRGVNIALGFEPSDSCPQFDPDDSGTVTVDEILIAVNNVLTGCSDGAPS